ncbi:MAG: NAD(P)H-dependent oxidoreductase [Candidatus Cloacimonetes bacterium]|nr:NAD(P)H-dependent oxidoreductase [Candidatus Cloacimonadota bacterium]
MKNCIVIHGSARRGNTYKATQMVMDSLKRLGGVEFEEIFLHDLKLPFCRGCFNCLETGEKYCADSAVIADLEARILSADALILTAPIYILQINAETKNLLDHFGYRFHRPLFFTKKALVITTTAGAGAKSGTKFMKQTLLCLGFNHVHSLPITCNSDVLPNTTKMKTQINRVSKDFFEDLASGKIHAPTLYQTAIYNAFRVNAENGRKLETCDYKYWRQNDMLNSVYKYKVGMVSKILGSLIYRILKKVIPS